MFHTNLAEITGGLLKALGICDLEPPQAVVQFPKHYVTDCQDLIAEVSSAYHTGPYQFTTIGEKVRQVYGNLNSKPTNLEFGSIGQYVIHGMPDDFVFIEGTFTVGSSDHKCSVKFDPTNTLCPYSVKCEYHEAGVSMLLAPCRCCITTWKKAQERDDIDLPIMTNQEFYDQTYYRSHRASVQYPLLPGIPRIRLPSRQQIADSSKSLLHFIDIAGSTLDINGEIMDDNSHRIKGNEVIVVTPAKTKKTRSRASSQSRHCVPQGKEMESV
jgi:hypothetical protein